jgi:hypothetical protein
MEDRINDHALWAECKSLAAEIFEEFKRDHGADFDPEDYRDDMNDRAHETADGHAWVIYTYRAIQLCSDCDTTRGEEFLDDIGGVEKGDTFGGIACKIAYGEIRRRVEEELDEIINAYEPEEAEENEDAA